MFKKSCIVLLTVLYVIVALPTETGQRDTGVVTRGVFATHGKPKTECLDHARIPSLRVGRKCFYIVNSFPAEWHNALRYCRANGLKLAKVSSSQENDAIVHQIRELGLANSSFWLSGTDLGSEGSFYWFEDEQPLFFSAWANGQPDNFKSQGNDGEHCIELRHIRNLEWNDNVCTRKNLFICESK